MSDALTSRNSPGFHPSILRHSGICGAVDEAVLTEVLLKKPKNLLKLKKGRLASQGGCIKAGLLGVTVQYVLYCVVLLVLMYAFVL